MKSFLGIYILLITTKCLFGEMSFTFELLKKTVCFEESFANSTKYVIAAKDLSKSKQSLTADNSEESNQFILKIFFEQTKLIYNSQWTNQNNGEIVGSFSTPQEGNYLYCFENLNQQSKLIQFGFKYKFEFMNENGQEAEHLLEQNLTILNTEKLLNEIQQISDAIIQQAEKSLVKEFQEMDFLVILGGVFALSAILMLTLIQLNYLKKFFTSKKLI